MAITLTEAAAQRVQHFLAQRGKGVGLRLGVKRTGCSGMAYVVDFADAVEPGELVFETQGITLVVDPQSMPYLDGTELDYGRDGLNEGFKFNNPNVHSTCGCGESFSV